jgi:hypothetical protein
MFDAVMQLKNKTKIFGLTLSDYMKSSHSSTNSPRFTESKFLCRFHKNPSLIPTVNKINPFHTPCPNFLRSVFNIILTSTPCHPTTLNSTVITRKIFVSRCPVQSFQRPAPFKSQMLYQQ